jgi:hypothetical protein
MYHVHGLWTGLSDPAAASITKSAPRLFGDLLRPSQGITDAYVQSQVDRKRRVASRRSASEGVRHTNRGPSSCLAATMHDNPRYGRCAGSEERNFVTSYYRTGPAERD